MSARTDLAQTIGRALRTEGFPYATAALCYAVADAIAERPGLLRAVIDAENVNNPARCPVCGGLAGVHGIVNGRLCPRADDAAPHQ